MPMPQAGDRAPDFLLPDQNGNTVSLAQLAGKNVVLYFYPKDDTPGCTREACNFRDEHPAMQRAGAVVLGVSPDDTRSHQKFASKYNLPFPLLADAGHTVADAYGVWGPKSLYGRQFLGINRATFLIGPDGRVRHSWPKVKVENHVNEVLEMLHETQGAAGSETPGAPETPAGGAEEPTVAEAIAEMKEEGEPSAARTKRSTKKSGARKPSGRSSSGSKAAGKTAARTGATKKAAGKKTAAKKGATKKAAGKKTAARKGATKKAATKKTAAKKGAAKKGAAKRGATKKAAAKKGGSRR